MCLNRLSYTHLFKVICHAFVWRVSILCVLYCFLLSSNSVKSSSIDLYENYQIKSHNASNQLLSHLFSKIGVLITMIWTTIGLSLIYALLLKYWKNLFYPKFLPTSTLTTFTILVNQHIVQVPALKQLFWKLLMICSFLLTKATYLY